MVTRPVLSFEGNVNTHTTLPLAVDPTERLLLSGARNREASSLSFSAAATHVWSPVGWAGGEDCSTRLWSLRSGCQLSTVKGFPSPITALTWHASVHSFSNRGIWWGAWMGCATSLFYVHNSK